MLLNILLKHEILNLLKNRRIYTAMIIFILLFASIFIVRVVDFQHQINLYLADVRDTEKDWLEAPNYSYLNPRAIKMPSVFSIYNQGFTFARVINIEFYEAIDSSEVKNEAYNRVFRMNQQMDITFLITFLLSLFALLISYDIINGEKNTGTLRLLMTFPIKRANYILKKILGAFLFVAFVFTLPYLMSLVSLIFIYSNLLTANFFLSAFFYWFLVLLFIFFFCLLGTLISCLTTDSSRSLVYALLAWVMLCIILPTGYDQIMTPRLYDNSILQLQQVRRDKVMQARNIFSNPPEDADPTTVEYMVMTGDWFYRLSIWSFTETHEQRYRFQRYLHDYYFPVAKEVEMATDDIIRKQINIENTRNVIFFFNPIVLFRDISMKIAGNSRFNYLKYLQDVREIRNDLVNIGRRDGWLFDYRFSAMFTEKDMFGSFGDWEHKFATTNFDDLYAEVMILMDAAEPFSFDRPDVRRYEQSNLSVLEIFAQIIPVLSIFVLSILALWTVTWLKFMKYDLR